MWKYFVLLCTLTCCGEAQAQSFLPPGTYFATSQEFADDFDFTAANTVIAKIKSIYTPIVSGFGAKLQIKIDESNKEINAYADRQGNTWRVTVCAGLVKQKEVGNDELTLVVTHELGHHLSGAPLYQGDSWAANEGQADVFSTHVGAKLVFADRSDDVQQLDATAVRKCQKIYKGQNLRVCYITLAASKRLGGLLARLGGEGKVSFDTPDKSVVSQTYDGHPRGQCRLDTYTNSALCQAVWSNSVIPDSYNQYQYNCSVDNYADVPVKRPYCWFKP